MSINERISETPMLNKIIIVVLIVVLIFGGWYYLYYIDSTKKINKLEKEVEKLSAYKRQLPILRVKYKKAQEEFKIYQKELPIKEEIPSLLVKLTDIIKSEDVALLSFKPKNAVDKRIYYLKPIDIRIVSTYKNCGSVFEKVAKMKRLFKIKDFTLTSPKIVSEHRVLLNVNFSAETYYFKNKKR